MKNESDEESNDGICTGGQRGSIGRITNNYATSYNATGMEQLTWCMRGAQTKRQTASGKSTDRMTHMAFVSGKKGITEILISTVAEKMNRQWDTLKG